MSGPEAVVADTHNWIVPIAAPEQSEEEPEGPMTGLDPREPPGHPLQQPGCFGFPATSYAVARGFQQYLARNRDGYCGLGGTGVACPVSLFAPDGAD